MNDTVTAPLANVEVTTARGNNVLTVTVPEHEVDVLRAIHGLDAVRVVDADAGEAELPANAHAELLRMQKRYRRIGAPDPVLIAFRDGARSLERHGFALGGARNEAAPQAGVRNHAVPKAKKQAAK